MQFFIAITRMAGNTVIVSFLLLLVSASAYGQDLLPEGLKLTDTRASFPIGRNAGSDSLLSRARFVEIFGQKLDPVKALRGVPLPGSEYRPDSPPDGSTRPVSWSFIPINPNTVVFPAKSASPGIHQGKSISTKRWIAGLLGAGLTGVGGYLLATSQGADTIQLCTLCSEPPQSQARIQSTGKQTAGAVSILTGLAFLLSAISLD